MSNSVRKAEYKCPDCGTEGKYTLKMERFVKPIYDGPFNLPIGWDDQGSVVQAFCDNCGSELDMTMEDFNRLYIPKKGIVFEK